MEPIMLGNTVHLDETKRIYEGMLNSGVVIAIALQLENTESKMFTIYNIGEQRVESYNGMYFKEWDTEIEKQHDTSGFLDCVKRIEIGDVVNSSEDSIKSGTKPFCGVVTNVEPYVDGTHNILTIKTKGLLARQTKVIEYTTKEFSDNILASEEDIKNMTATGTKR